jgi:hypothetical protein
VPPTGSSPIDPALLGRAVAREPLGDDGLSGATLERVWLHDSRTVVVKRQSPRTDLFMRILGDEHGRELDLYQRGILDLLPPSIRHAVIGGWVEGETTVIVMRDLGDRVLGWRDRLSPPRTRDLVGRLAEMHARFAGAPPEGLAPLPPLVATFAPSRLEPFVAIGHPIVAAALDGWGLFAWPVPGDVADAVEALLDRPDPLVTALSECTPTLCHGDLATVNLAWEDDGGLTLIDWGQAVAAPGEFDITRLLAGCAPVLGLAREAFLDEYRLAAPGFSARAMRLSLLAGLLWLGWNKALDASRHPTEAKRAQERDDLAWWVQKGREALHAGL